MLSSLDAIWMYRQMSMAEEKKDKTTFTRHSRACWSCQIIFKHMETPSVFQQASEIMGNKDSRGYCVVYLDDVIFLKSIAQHLQDIEDGLEKEFMSQKYP